MSKPTPRSSAYFPLAFSCEQRWGLRRTGACPVGERTDSARRAQLLDEVREAERASRMVPEGRDGGADPLQGLGAECPLDLLEVSLLRSEEHTSELQSRLHLVCRLLLEKKKKPK